MAAQFGRPASTVSTGSWTVVGAPTLHEATDEVTANDDTDYANATVNTTAELRLSSVLDPGVNSGHIVRWRFNPNGSGGAERIIVDLYQGGALIRSSGYINGIRGVYNSNSFTLTGPEADLISNYSDLRLKITTDSGSGDSMRVTWLEFEVPNASVNTPPSLSISQPDGIGDTVTVGDPYNVTYTLSDPDNVVTAAFYYDTNNTGFDGTTITGVCATATEGTNITCSWNTTGVASGSYYVYGITNDGVNPAVSAYSPGQITIGGAVAEVTIIGMEGTQVANIPFPSTGQYVGGAFTFIRSIDSADVTSITITETGTVNANSNLSNVKLFYETAATCTYDGNEIQFGTAQSFSGIEKAIFSGTMPVDTSQVCVYAVLDIGYDATYNQTLEIEISSLADVVVSAGTMSGVFPTAIAGTTTLQSAFQEILNKLNILETKVDNLQAQTNQLPQNIWEYANRNLTSFGTLAADIWVYSSRSLNDISNISQGVWEYSARSLTSFGTLVSDIWSNTTRTLTSGTSIAQDIWNATTRKLTSRQIGVSEYIAGVTESDTVSQVADQPTQANVEYNVELVRKATFDFAGIADGGSTLTLADAELDQPNNYWSNYELIMMSGANIGQKRAISGFDKNTNTITISSAFSSPIASGDQYVISHEGKLVNAIWSYADRTLTGFGTLAADIWSYPNRTLTAFGSLAADVWNNTFAPTRRLTDNTLSGGGQLSTTADLTTAKDAIIAEVNENQTLVAALNNISAADVWSYANRGLTQDVNLTATSSKAIWDVAKTNLVTTGSIGEQVANNLDAAVSSRSTLTAANVWSESTRTLTDYATSSISLAVWSEATRELTNYGNNITAQDVWNVLSSTLALENSIGKQLAGNVDVAVSTRASQASIDALNNISATDVWSYANRGLTEEVALTSTSTDAIWEYALTQIGDAGSIGKLLKDNIDATISSRGTSTITAADVWNEATRTLTSNANFNDPDSATIATAVWSNATKELTNYGNNITAQDVWNILSANLTTEGTIGKQLATNVDAAISTRSTLTAANVWEYTNRSLTDFGTLVADIWNYSTRSLTTFGTLVADIWSNTSRTLTSALLSGGGQLATTADLNTLKSDIITEVNENQTLIENLNSVTAAEIWSYGTRGLTENVDLTSTSTKAIWDVAKANLTTTGSIGKQIADNLDAAISSRSTLTAADVWSAATRTLTDYATSSISLAVWSNATKELTNYGNNITAQDVWNVLSSTLALENSIGKQLATNVDAAISSRSTLTAANVWEYTNRSLTDFGTLVADIWNYSTRSLTSFGSLAADIWNNTFAPTRRLTDQTLTGGGSLATEANVTAAKNEIIALINGLNNISAANVWAYSNRSLTDPDSIWEYALTQIGNSGSIGMLLKDNINATISSRGTSVLTANDVWTAAVRTLTANTNLGISTPAQIADAIWDEALADHVVAGSTGKALGTAIAGGAGGAGGLKIETHTVSEFEQGDTAAVAVIQVLNNGVPVTSGVTPTGKYYGPDNQPKTWSPQGETVTFTQIAPGGVGTGIYTNNFIIPQDATLGVYKLAVSAALSSGGSDYDEDFETGTVGEDMAGWGNTGATYSVQDDPVGEGVQGQVYHKSDYGGFMFAYSTEAGNQADFTYTAKVMMPTYTLGGQYAGSDMVGITFRYLDSGNNYIFYFRRASGNVRLMKHTNGGTATLQETPSGSVPAVKDTWYTMKVEVTGGNIKAYVLGFNNNEPLINYTDLAPHKEGMVGVFTYNSIGFWDDIVVTTEGTSEYAYIAKDFAIVTPKATQSSIISAQDVWNVATSSLTTTGSIGKALADNRVIKFNANGEVAAGSGTNNYRAKLYINDLSTQPVSPVSSPSITLYGPAGTIQAGPTNMTKDEKGIYSYQTTLGSWATTGRWEAIVTINIGGASTIKTSGYFEVEASPTRVTINFPIRDNTVPDITANFTIVNEGDVGFDYPYEFCIVDTIENQCGTAGGADMAWGQDTTWIKPGILNAFTIDKTLNIGNNPGTYYYKAVSHWGTERSVGALQFDAVFAPTPTPTPTATPTPTPAPGGGGGGGGGGGAPAPTPVTTSAACSGADFNHDGVVNSVDFSILLYFWKTQPPFRNSCVDINQDAQVNSVDFSILLYQWGKPGVNIK